MVIYALGFHQRNGWAGRTAGLCPALACLETCHELGAGGVQVPLASADLAHLAEFRRHAEAYGMHFEAIIQPPATPAEVERFEREVIAAKEAGATLARTVIMPGRRYEQFKSLAEYREAAARGRRALELAEPVLARHRFCLAVENHKDQRVDERLELLLALSSEFIGMCVDVGNSFALLEDPVETARAYAPWAMTVHLKDHCLAECPEGFLVWDVALGEGFLDLPAIVRILRDAKPRLRFNLESITRNPITVPVLTAEYWATLSEIPARELGRTLRTLKAPPHPREPIMVSKLTPEAQWKLERQHIERSLRYARERLHL